MNNKSKDDAVEIFKRLRDSMYDVDDYLSLSSLDVMYGEDNFLDKQYQFDDVLDFLIEFTERAFHKLDKRERFLIFTIFIILNSLRIRYRSLVDLHCNKSSIVAKQNRAKRKPQENPNKEKARNRAKEIWAKYSKQSQLDTAYQIKEELNIEKESVVTIKDWISDLSPNVRKKKTSK